MCAHKGGELLQRPAILTGTVFPPYLLLSPILCPVAVSTGASLVAQMVKNLPAKQETWVQPLGQEDPMQKEMATHSSILAWRIPWTEEIGGLQSMGSQRVRQD